MKAGDQSGTGAGKGAERKARLAEALRANLARRKAQARARRAGEADQREEGIAAADVHKKDRIG
jgi:hypothetical protein